MWPCSFCSQFSRLHVGLLILCLIPTSQQQIPSSLRYHLKDVRTAEEFKNLIMLYSNGQKFVDVNENIFEDEIDKISKPKRDDDTINTLGGLRGRSRVTRRSPTESSEGFKISDFPTCSPRETVVDIPKGNDPNVFFLPPCVTLQKCSGCCSDLYECTSVKTIPKVVNVYKRVPAYASFVENIVMTMEEDKECQCLCKVQEKHCNLSIHRYVQCSCQCIKGRQTCPETMYWDTQTCSCVCNATPQQRICSRKRQVFDEELCACDCKKHARERCQLPRLFNEMKCKCEEVLPPKITPSLQVPINKCVPVVCPFEVNFNLKSCQCEEGTETPKYTTKESAEMDVINHQP